MRGLAWVVVKWAKLVRPRVIILENVREFADWGPLIHARAARKPGRHELLTSPLNETLSAPDLKKWKAGYLFDKEGRPVLLPDKSRKGQTFRRWIGALRSLGYVVEWRMLNAADYGAPTHRRRLFLVARCDGKAVVWPAATHGRVNHKDTKRSSYGGEDHLRRMREGSADGAWPGRPVAQASDVVPAVGQGRNSGRLLDAVRRQDRKGDGQDGRRAAHLKPYRTAAECIDWSIPCPSIFGRKKPLAAKTQRRIAMGLLRYVLESPRPYIVRCNHGGEEFRGQSIDQPLGTISAKHGYGVVAPVVVGAGGPDYSAKPTRADEPLRSVMTDNHRAVAAANLLSTAHTGTTGRGKYVDRIDEPVKTLTSWSDKAVVETALAAHVTKFRFDSAGVPVDEPLPTITAGGHPGARPAGAAHAMAVTQTELAPYLVQRNGEREGQSPRAMPVDRPGNTVVPTGNGQNLVAAHVVRICQTGGKGEYTSAPAEPLGTVVSKQEHCHVETTLKPASPWVVKNYGGVTGHDVKRPIGTVTSVDHHGVGAAFVSTFHGQKGGESRCNGLDEPARTIDTQNRHAIAAAYVAQMNHGEKQWHATDSPLRTITSQGNKFASVQAFLTKYFGNEKDGYPVGEPAHTVTSRDRFALVAVESHGQSAGGWLLTERALKRARQVASWAKKQLGVKVRKHLIRVTNVVTGAAFSLLVVGSLAGGPHLVTDVGMRMFQPRELARAQGFPDEYVLTGTKANQVHKIGNSVPPVMAMVLSRANCPELIERITGRGKERKGHAKGSTDSRGV